MSRKFTLKHSWLFLAFFCAFSITEVEAQDPHFSQFNAAPLQLNPAMAGVYEGQFRVGINYRDQWGSVLGPVPYQTSNVSFDFRVYAFKDDYFGLWGAKIPMSTTWLFVGLLAGREIGIRINLEGKLTREITQMIIKDFLKILLGLAISVILVFIIKILAA